MANIHWKPKLTEKQVRTLPAGRYTDGQGLMLFVLPSGARSWVQRIVIQGKRVDIGLGGYPLVSMTEAREQAFENRRIARKGGDPRVKPVPVPTFADAARSVHREQTPSMKNPTDRAKWINELINHAFPTLADRRVSEITTAEIKNGVLLPIWYDKPTVAKRIRQRIVLIMDWVIVEGFRNDNPARALDRVLPKATGNGNGSEKKHFTALPHAEVGQALAMVRTSSKPVQVKLAFEFLVLTAVRSHEVRGARWDEIDLESRTWTIPKERMKAGKEHQVPLSDRAMEILEQARELLNSPVNEQSGLVFPNRGKPIDEKVLPRTMKDLSINAVPHGFRSSFRDWCSECTDVPREVAEAAIAHETGGKVEKAYARSKLFDRRVKLMQQWADYLKRE